MRRYNYEKQVEKWDVLEVTVEKVILIRTHL